MSNVRAALGGLCFACCILFQPTTPARAAILLHEYLFDGAGVTDTAGSANGTLFGGATIGSGVLSLDGVNDYVEFGAKLVPTGLSAFSVTMDAKQLSRGPGFIEMISQGSSGPSGFYIGHNPGGNFRFGDQHTVTGIPFPNDNLFHSYALTSDGLGTNFYVDGFLVFTSGIQIGTTAIGSNTRLGRQFDPFGEFFHGNLDNVRIYSGALTAEEISSGIASKVSAPGALALFGLGLAGLSFAGRKRTA